MRLLLGLLLAALLPQAEPFICSCADDEECVSDNTCICNSTMYASSTDNDLAPLLTCHPLEMTIAISKCRVEALDRSPQSSYLLDSSCITVNETIMGGIRVNFIQILTLNGSCGNNVETDANQTTFWNVLHIPPLASGASGQLNVPFSCSYTLNMQDGRPSIGSYTLSCSAPNDVSTTVKANGVSLEVLFSVDMFAFQSYSTFHIFCDVRLCDKTGTEDCTGCTSMRSRDLGPGSGTVGFGPVVITAYDQVSFGSCTGASWVVLVSSLLAPLSLRLA
ncbi:pancreatic secretory granule membrane major glycoprotein GP2-like isoform X3 [Ambystoma mexicanum]|uniref:pancreatic secretory granule membrane major glycoprotein GP2-like isoform X3 n=1 Tax=Ambystoma mexicanum TaxID=8296 RepID=UPI0037E976C1